MLHFNFFIKILKKAQFLYVTSFHDFFLACMTAILHLVLLQVLILSDCMLLSCHVCILERIHTL